jgi:unsaturated rhamnogalacturonyl hydrolase
MIDYAIIDKYIDRLIEDTVPEAPIWNIESIHQGKKPAWNYIDGCMMNSLYSMYKQTGDKKYLDFIDKFVDYYVFEDGTIRGYALETYNLDNLNEGRILFDLYAETGKEKYNKAIELLHKQIEGQPRIEIGNFWHKKIYPNQVWLDGIYMAQVFYTRYVGERGNKDYSDIVRQFTNVYENMYDKEKRLYYHGWDYSKQAFWADKTTGRSKSFWLRAIGWYTVGLVDVIGYMAEYGADARAKLCEIFKQTIEGLERYIDPEKKMFYQVVDQMGREGNYLETSGSAMIAYAMMKGARLGIIDKRFAAVGQDVFNGICNQYLTSSNGTLNLGGICLVAGLGPENNPRRNGTFEYYISEPIVENVAKVTGAFVMDYTVIKLLKK